MTDIPIVISESNSDSSDAQDRTGSPFEWAAMPFEYKAHVEAGTWRVLRWETYERNYNLVDAISGQPQTTYWAERKFWEAVQEGSTRVGCSSSSDDVACLASVTAGGKLDVVLINIGVASPNDNNGSGVKHQVDVHLADGSSPTFTVVTIDRNTSPAAGPSPSTGPGLGVTIDGYGLATLEGL